MIKLLFYAEFRITLALIPSSCEVETRLYRIHPFDYAKHFTIRKWKVWTLHTSTYNTVGHRDRLITLAMLETECCIHTEHNLKYI